MVPVRTCLHLFRIKIWCNEYCRSNHNGILCCQILNGPNTFQYNNCFDKQVIKSDETIIKVEYLSKIKSNTNWYWQQLGTKESEIIATHAILYPCLDV